MPDKMLPKVDTNSQEMDRQMSAVLRGARTMGPGRSGGAAEKAALEALLLATPAAAGSVLPSGASAVDASRNLSQERMAALLKAMQNSKRLLPSPTTR